MPFKKPSFERGKFLTVISNGTGLIVLSKPLVKGTNATPFDQSVSNSIMPH
jgi:hypothetical protein